MKPVWLAATILVAIPAIASAFSTPPPAKAGPAIVPYLCSEGVAASAMYENGSGSRHARALVTYRGETVALDQAPTLYGVRYRAASPSGTTLAWSLRGEEAWLTESPDADGYTREERAIARCVRLRGAAAPADEGHDPDSH